MNIKTVKNVQKQVTRPTSVTIMLLLFQGVQLLFPDSISKDLEGFIYNLISVVGATGIIDKIWRSRKNIKEWFLNLFTKKEE